MWSKCQRKTPKFEEIGSKIKQDSRINDMKITFICNSGGTKLPNELIPSDCKFLSFLYLHFNVLSCVQSV